METVWFTKQYWKQPENNYIANTIKLMFYSFCEKFDLSNVLFAIVGSVATGTMDCCT